MSSLRRLSVPLLALALLAAPIRIAGQAPGAPQVDPRAALAEYHAEVIWQVNRVLTEWAKAWEEDRLEQTAGFYWENAVLILPGQIPLRGRDDIRKALSELLPDVGRVEPFMLDFDASGGMAVVYGNFRLEEAGAAQAGPLVTVFLQRGRTWKIRSQVFVAP